MDARAEELSSGLGRFLSERWRPGTRASELAHIPGGASRETWRFLATAGGEAKGMIVRLDPDSSLIDTDRRTEFRAIDAAYRAGLPAPEAMFLEEDKRWLGRSFSITAEVPNCQANFKMMADENRTAIGRQKYHLLGRIAVLDPIALGLGDIMPATSRETCAMDQLEYWAKVIADDEIHPNPVAQAAVRWLRRRPPPPAQKLALVHGDYRTGNFLFDAGGQIRAILDWEMAHMGDPYEDLAWSFDPLWSWAEPHLAGRLLPHAEAVRWWEEGSGLAFDAEAFRWWRVFAALKGVAIWISSSEDFHRAAVKPPVLGVTGWLMTDRQERILADYLSPHSKHRLPEVVK